jgi:hypothetical protein
LIQSNFFSDLGGLSALSLIFRSLGSFLAFHKLQVGQVGQVAPFRQRFSAEPLMFFHLFPFFINLSVLVLAYFSAHQMYKNTFFCNINEFEEN